jgi:pilus assembly protein CpaF
MDVFIRYRQRYRDEQPQLLPLVGPRFLIGSGSSMQPNDADGTLLLESPRATVLSARIIQQDHGWTIEALASDVLLDNCPLEIGDIAKLTQKSRLAIGSYDLDFTNKSITTGEASLQDQDADWICDIHCKLVNQLSVQEQKSIDPNDIDELSGLENRIRQISRQNWPSNTQLIEFMAGAVVKHETLERLITASTQESNYWRNEHHSAWNNYLTRSGNHEDKLEEVVTDIMEELCLSECQDFREQVKKLENSFAPAWTQVSGSLATEFCNYLVIRRLTKEIKDIFFGFGPLQDLLQTPTVSEIMVVSHDRIFIERDGKVEDSGRRFVSDERTMDVMDRIVSRVGRSVNRNSPMVDARLPDGSRVNAVIPPVGIRPALTIRKFPTTRLTMHELVHGHQSLTVVAARFLQAAVAARCNILVSGGTSSGKTTLLNCLSDFISERERVVVIEDTTELQLSHHHLVQMETKKENAEGKGSVEIRDLVRNALRMRPDRIVVGEVRGGEALDMLQAMNTGHDGSLTTLHANRPEDVPSRLSTLALQAVDLPERAINRQIAAAIDLIVHLEGVVVGGKLGRKVRRVTRISEVHKLDDQGQVCMKDIFRADRRSEESSTLQPTGLMPNCIERLLATNLIELEAIFI